MFFEETRPSRTVDYKNIDGDNAEERIFKLDVSNIPYASGTTCSL